MPADGMRATPSPERRFGSPVSIARYKAYRSFFDNDNTVVSIASEPTGKGDDWPNPPHPANLFLKTLTGTAERGFDYLGYHFTRAGLSVARKTFVNFLEKTSRLYEQECRAGHASAALEMFVRRWVRRTTSGGLSPNMIVFMDKLATLAPARQRI